MTFEEELRDKVARMRALGIVEIETSNGFVRRLRLGPKPVGVEAAAAAPVEPVEPTPPAPPPEDKAKADEASKRAMIDRRKFGAGK